MLPFRAVLGEAELDFKHYSNHRGRRPLIVSVVKCSILFYKCLWQFTLSVSGVVVGMGGWFILQRANSNISYYFCDASNPWRTHEFLFLPKNWMVTLSICSIQHVQDHVRAKVFPSLCFTCHLALSHALPLILFLISCSVF